MKSLGKILARYVLSAAGIALALIFINAAVFFTFVIANAYDAPGFDRRLGELAASVRWDSGRWAADGSVLEGDYCWAMLLGDSGDILWEEALPAELRRHYTVGDVASFTRWYLADYPASCRQTCTG